MSSSGFEQVVVKQNHSDSQAAKSNEKLVSQAWCREEVLPKSGKGGVPKLPTHIDFSDQGADRWKHWHNPDESKWAHPHEDSQKSMHAPHSNGKKDGKFMADEDVNHSKLLSKLKLTDGNEHIVQNLDGHKSSIAVKDSGKEHCFKNEKK